METGPAQSSSWAFVLSPNLCFENMIPVEKVGRGKAEGINRLVIYSFTED